MNPELKAYIAAEIFPRYEKFYSHGLLHINSVIENALMLAKYYNLDLNLAYTAAAYHDLGLKVNREHHELESGKILVADQRLSQFFTAEQIQLLRAAVEDHRGSRKTPPRNFYGKIISDSDRDFDIKILAKRQLATSIKNYPEHTTFDEHFDRCHKYICQRLNSTGHFNLWTNNPLLIQRRDQFERDYLNRDYARSVYLAEWERISHNGTLEKIQHYYEDF